MRASRLQLMLILVVLGLVLMRESRHTPGSTVEKLFVDWLATNTARDTSQTPVVLVEINESSLDEGHSWPWSPLDFSLFLQAALPFEPSVLAIEHVLLWDEKTPGGEEWRAKHPQYERILHDFLLRAPQVLLGAQLGFPEDPDVIPPLQPVPVMRNVKGSVVAVPEFTIVDRQPKEEFRLAPKLGFTNVPVSDLPARTAPLILRYRGEVVPSFVLQAMMMWHQVTPDEVKIEVNEEIDLGGKVRIPIDETGAVQVYFKAAYPRIGFDDLLLAAQQREGNPGAVTKADALRGAIALLARTDRRARTLEFPSGVPGSTGELSAAAIATIQSHAFIRRLPVWGDLVILGSLLALVPLLCQWRWTRVLQVAASVLVVYLMIGMAVFTVSLVWLPLVMPIGVLLFAVLFCLVSPRST